MCLYRRMPSPASPVSQFLEIANMLVCFHHVAVGLRGVSVAWRGLGARVAAAVRELFFNGWV
jgi:hypothetical protein